jgi:FkbM family methyltransferase
MLRHLANIARRIKRHLIPSAVCAASIAKLFDRRPAVVVQVGSNDGVQGDPIAPLIRKNPDWQVLFIEPLPHIFQRLLANYPHSQNYRFENVAISETTEMRLLYYVSDEIKKLREGIPYWYDQIGSFDKKHILKHGKEFESFIVSEPVRCEPLRDILARNRIKKIDLLHIDTEGYDYEVLKQVDLKGSPPRVILYEHKHLSTADQSAARSLLLRVGYRVRPEEANTLAIMRGKVAAMMIRFRYRFLSSASRPMTASLYPPRYVFDFLRKFTITR